MVLQSRGGGLGVGHRHDGPDDEVPVRRQRDRHHRLDVQRVAVGIVRPEAAVEIVLEGHADQACDGIGELLGKIRVVLLGGSRQGESGQREREKGVCQPDHGGRSLTTRNYHVAGITLGEDHKRK